tara:strand:+ start:1922 stop:2095 length:174 start_codon:yes stop_codon:yes gene_type:complete
MEKTRIQIFLEPEQVKWLDDNKGSELSRGGLIRTLIRKAMENKPDAYEYQLIMGGKD